MENNKLKQFQEEIDKNIYSFLYRITAFCREGFEYDRGILSSETSGFPILGLSDTTYYKGKNQEGFLEWQVRDLVNSLLDYLFKSHNYDIRWRINQPVSTPWDVSEYRNIGYEKRFPVEFVIVKKDVVKAYRYSPFYSDFITVSDFFEFHLSKIAASSLYSFGIDHVDQLVSIQWSEDNDQTRSICNYSGSQGGNLWTITIKQFFEEFFSEGEYNVFINKLQKAVSEANSILRFQTISRLRFSNLGLFKQKIQNELVGLDLRSLDYIIVDKRGNTVSKRKFREVIGCTLETLVHNTIGKHRYLALVGTRDFAVSYLTSEYLFQVFRNNSPIDYTSVVSGYIKSVEQLSSVIISEFIIPQYDERIYIPIRPIRDSKRRKEVFTQLKDSGSYREMGERKTPSVSMKRENEAFFRRTTELSLDQMFWFFRNNSPFVFCFSSPQSTLSIFECMENYCQCVRNGFFHKHNIISEEFVEKIRNDTILLLFWLLGVCQMFESEEANSRILGIVDDTFDCIFRKVFFRRESRYTLVYGDGVKHNVKLKPINQKRVNGVPSSPLYEFDDYGYFKKAELQFVEEKLSPESEGKETVSISGSRETVFVVDRDHLPVEMYLIDKAGNSIRLI